MTSAALTPRQAPSRPACFWRAALAEWTKFRTLRSSFWTLLIAAAVNVGLGAGFLPFKIDLYDGPAYQAATAAIREGWWFEGLHAGIMVVMILGVLVASAEYSTGTMHATLGAVPSRTRVLAAKVASFAAVTLVAGVAQALAAFLVARPILADRSIQIPLTDPAALRGIGMATLAIAGAGLFGLGAGLLIRHTAGAIGAVVAVMWVVGSITLVLPERWVETADKFHPASAMYAMFTPDPDRLAVGPATAVFFGWVALLLAVAGVLFARRDA